MGWFDDLARWQLWGGKMKRNARPSLLVGLWGDFQYFILGNRDRRLPSALDIVDWWIMQALQGLLGGQVEPDRLPDGFPTKLFETVEKVVLHRGGMFDRDHESPNFWVDRGQCTVTPFAYVIPVGYELSADPKKVMSWEEALEDRLAAAGYDLNVRIALRPLRIEIDKDKPPIIRLADYWSEISTLPTNQSLCVPGVALQGGQIALQRYALVNDQLSNRVVGAPGSGKTQLTLGMMITLCYLNSPQHVSLLIIDPKVVDWLPLARLPHLAAPIAKSPAQALELIHALVAEMERRTRAAEAGLKVAQMKTILLYIDEMADLVMAAPKLKEQIVTGIQRLTQTGRGLRIGVLGATQRIYDLPAAMYSKMNGKFVGRTDNAGDGAAAAGSEGVKTHKLPGKGAFELYPGAERLQGFFVADPDRDDYTEQLQRYAAAIQARWAGQGLHWTPERAFGGTDDQEVPEEAVQTDLFMEKALQAYLADAAGFTKRELRRLYEAETGKGISGANANKLWDRLMAYGREKFNADDGL